MRSLPAFPRPRLRVGLALCTALAALLWVPVSTLVAAPVAHAATAPVSYQSPYTPSPSVAGATTPFTSYEARKPAARRGRQRRVAHLRADHPVLQRAR